MTESPMSPSTDFLSDFFYGSSELFLNDRKDTVQASICMQERMEGWIGIPHGGLGMGIMTDLALRVKNCSEEDNSHYPFSAEFRLGGASLKIDDTLRFEVVKSADGAQGQALVDGVPLPYMSGIFHNQKINSELGALFSGFMPDHMDQVMNHLTPLPSYKKCFVCGFERTHPGLARQFYQWNNHKVVVSHAGFDKADQDSFYAFNRNGFLHTLPFLALLDETLGWGGFLISASGAVTVKIDYTFYRPVSIREKLIFFGHGDRVRGKHGSRLMFWASGGAAAVKDDGRLEMVVSSSGQWYGVPDLTQQMKKALQPKNLMERVFALAAE